MKEVGLNTTQQTQGQQRAKTVAQSTARGEVNLVVPTDTIDANLSRTPDFTQVDQDAEARFDAMKKRLREEVNQDHYPPAELIEKVSKMLANPAIPPPERD